jgi:hypothetical protein
VLGLAALAAGCGSSGPSDLARPVLATCGVSAFNPAQVQPTKDRKGGKAWRVSYLLRKGQKIGRGTATTILILETTSSLPRGHIKGGHDQTIAGRSVSVHPPDPTFQGYAGQWKTSRARYVVIANNGSRSALRRMVACLP